MTSTTTRTTATDDALRPTIDLTLLRNDLRQRPTTQTIDVAAIATRLDPNVPITLFSHGMGQDSAGIAALLYDPDRPALREQVLSGRQLLVVHSDTLAEHAYTVAYRKHARGFFAMHDVPYVELQPHDGFHSGGWRGGLLGQWDRNSTVGSAAFPASCSDSLKASPIWALVNELCGLLYGVDPHKHPGKNGLREHQRRFGKLVCIIGFAKGEENRRLDAGCNEQLELIPSEKKTVRKWLLECVERVTPLIDLGMDRAAIQAYLQSRGLPCPPPSNCWACPYKSRHETLFLLRTDPAAVELWRAIEKRKLETWAAPCAANGKANHGVKGRKTLDEFLDEAERLHGTMSTEALYEHVYSHGHKIPSKA
jgi:hypothetical protein